MKIGELKSVAGKWQFAFYAYWREPWSLRVRPQITFVALKLIKIPEEGSALKMGFYWKQTPEFKGLLKTFYFAPIIITERQYVFKLPLRLRIILAAIGINTSNRVFCIKIPIKFSW